MRATDSKPTNTHPGWGKSAARLRKLEKIAARDGGWKCVWCGGHLFLECATIEHIIPRSLGGTDRLGNLGMACIPCNVTRGAPPGESYSAKDVAW